MERYSSLVLVVLFHAWLSTSPALARHLPLSFSSSSSPTEKHFQFNLEWKNVTRLGHTKPVLTVNGQYPGPTIEVREGDHVVIKVTNSVSRNTTLHWHGIRQLRTGWADGPAYITQCPIQSNTSFTYRFEVKGQRGTLWWHAHLAWQRASVHGALIILPAGGMPRHFPTHIHGDFSIILGEWWNSDVETVEKDAVLSGGGPEVSDAYTINGFPGPLYSSCKDDTFTQTVVPGKTYILRLINAALNDELFFAIDGHTLTVVEVDAVYLKPFNTSAVMITPGQTTTVLLTTNAAVDGRTTFPLAIQPYVTGTVPFDNSTAIGFLHYSHHHNTTPPTIPTTPALPLNLPIMLDTAFATDFSDKLLSLASHEFPCNVPKEVDREFLLTIGLNLQDCCRNCTCKGFDGKRFAASMNNQSFIRPPVSMLQSYYSDSDYVNRVNGFPKHPANPFNYTGEATEDTNMNAGYGSKLIVVPFGTRMEIVLQDTSFVSFENHPIHIHGHNFFVVGRGFGNYDRERDRKGYNLVDPPERNTVAVPSAGWAALRLTADNPGVWFVHCHLEVHTTWGLATGIIVKNGKETSQSIMPPPEDLPGC